MNKILVIAAHPDDEILGLAGTVKKYINSGYKAYCSILGEGMTSRTPHREDTPKGLIDSLQNQTLQAAKIIGFERVYFSDFPDNRFDSVGLLDIIKEVDKYVQLIKPDIIYTHHYGDLNIDHRKTFEAVITACRPVREYCVKEIYCFETLSSTEWNFQYGDNTFKPNVFVNIEDTLQAKLDAMECYQTELGEYPHPRSLKALEVIAAKWGTVVGRNYAEAFELIRKVD
ncbi:PIG-L deacetylase family protein [Desulfosporosinus lacus]|uniref:N-acetylglucosaminyl deacetylase, LmbE family n=1 Tax=Desulfosporosinus lacus DSM 15449 TaxID=1121420 RepID=A0A1M5UWD1_9FIRM|nr:PIG-L family deacetylase [Desulfosporosinus lacus]SHH67244.1 N-acetylglucosaminyl deacetylase, LmbE family [Desulfosporosinus lacus DSM 15449]